MTHHSWSDVPFELDVDAVIVGSGAGGASAAIALARGGWSVAVVEAGPWRDTADYPTSSYGMLRDMFDDWGSTFTRGRALWPVVQARAVGGTTTINSAICVRTPGDVFARWRLEHGVDGLEDDVGRAQDAIGDELSATDTPAEVMGRNSGLMAAGAKKLGYEHHPMRRYAKDCTGSGMCISGCREGKKQSLNVTWLPEVLQKGGVILSNAPVKRVILEGGAATGVTGWFKHPITRKWGGKFTVRARKAVIVAASATHSAPLLQRSGLRNPALGTAFRAHPGTGVFGVYDDPVDMAFGATQGLASLAFRESPGFKLESLSLTLDMIGSRLPGGGALLTQNLEQYRHVAMWVHAVRAESAGTVRNGLFDRPAVHYTLDRADMERFRAGMVTLARTHFAAGARKVLPGVFGLPSELGPDDVGLLETGPLDPRRYFAILSHLFGGCPMGIDPAKSVVDANGRVHGVNRLLVTDASAIPTNLGVNPQHTIMALARVWSERLLAT